MLYNFQLMKYAGENGIVMMLSAQASASVLSRIFVGYDAELLAVTEHAFVIFSCSYLLSGVNIYMSSFFTALNNGGMSAAISFLRALVFQTGAVLILPLLLGIDGIWWAVTVSEVMACVISMIFMAAKRRSYHY